MTRVFACDDGFASPAAAALPAGTVTRRGILAGFAGLAAVPALAALDRFGGGPSDVLGARPDAVATDRLRGGARRFSHPFLSPGHRIRLPRGVEVIPASALGAVAPHRLAPGGPYPWPSVPTRDGGTVDLSTVPEPGAPSAVAYLTGFKNGWYELADPRGRTAARVEWNARKMPYLWFWSEWGASTQYPFWGRFYTLGLEPFSRGPVS